MTNELDGDVITLFVSGGAKNYGYTTQQGKVLCKVRGFTLNVRVAAVLCCPMLHFIDPTEMQHPELCR